MKLSDVEWSFVRRHSLRPTICAAVASIALVVGFLIQQEKYHAYISLVANQEAVHEDYDNLLRQRAIIDRYHRRYQQFHELGFIGRESRLDWVEYMRVTTEELALPSLSYSIEPQMAAASPIQAAENAAQIQIRVSDMQLELGLFHELDLLRLFDHLQTRAPGLIHVDRCAVTLNEIASSATLQPSLLANCELKVFSAITSDVDRGGS